ncbi:toxin-antitoxin system YwqK family antitoxin [Campylobacter insulaenigrae]|uniref:toxin-antitoxin system YwqK family antitoxin n=1 Tax=Campylobacter insulaenigrae TaxID=260714 RepID=UPI002152432A|nr:toxin-antitoxin system YwqK family antitoxin [Campylobacter insulaenigrae]MCR6578946.1 toxin-antitoxin system YwqK family antitoxin [Campylobacter insulaenigrae]
MNKKIKISFIAGLASLFVACGGEKFPGQPSDTVKVNQSQYTNGNLKEEIPYNSQSRIHGVKRTFFSNGQLQSEEEYKDGKKEGFVKQYFENGQLQLEAQTKNNQYDGQFKSYYDDGKIEVEGTYKNGKYIGAYKLYASNGNIVSEQNYNKDGKKDGIFKEYSPDGALMSEEEYKNDLKNGIFRKYRNGAIIDEQKFENGKLIQK